MTPWKPVGLLLACVLTCSAAAAAAPTTITLDEALVLAEERSPVLLAARSERDAAIGAARGAGALPNPVVNAGLGTRSSVDATEVQVGVSQSLRLAEVGPSQRGARARAEASEAWTGDAERRVIAEVSSAFVRVRHADARVAIAEDAADLAGEVLAATTARVRVGEASDLELGTAELASARAQAVVASERANRQGALGALRVALGAEAHEVLEPVGPILSRERYAALSEGAQRTRADVEALNKEVLAAEADLRLARALALPDLGIWGRYAEEEGALVTAAGLSLEIPLWDRSQGERTVARVRVQQAEGALQAGQRAASVELNAATEVYRLRLEAVDLLETIALPRAIQQSSAAGRAYELGELGLTELLLIRGQITLARLQQADAELDAALAGVAILAVAGWTP